MAFEVPRPQGAGAPERGGAVADVRSEGGVTADLQRLAEVPRSGSLVPVGPVAGNTSDETTPPTPSTPKPRDRPRLTRVK
jgi:hypothetical protein